MNSLQPLFLSSVDRRAEKRERERERATSSEHKLIMEGAYLLTYLLTSGEIELICIRMGVVTCNEAIFSHPPPHLSPSSTVIVFQQRHQDLI